jgi:hypothetical protein
MGMFVASLIQPFRRTCSVVGRRLVHHEGISTDIRKRPIRLRPWDPWKSPYTYILALMPFFTFGLGTWQVRTYLVCTVLRTMIDLPSGPGEAPAVEK